MSHDGPGRMVSTSGLNVSRFRAWAGTLRSARPFMVPREAVENGHDRETEWMAR